MMITDNVIDDHKTLTFHIKPYENRNAVIAKNYISLWMVFAKSL